jgi:cephalosporin-C deacetylase-like acetyl esterase
VRARKERAGFIEEDLTFLTTQYSHVPAYLLIPTDRKPPFPAVIVLHDHGGFYMWGREKWWERKRTSDSRAIQTAILFGA